MKIINKLNFLKACDKYQANIIYAFLCFRVFYSFVYTIYSRNKPNFWHWCSLLLTRYVRWYLKMFIKDMFLSQLYFPLCGLNCPAGLALGLAWTWLPATLESSSSSGAGVVGGGSLKIKDENINEFHFYVILIIKLIIYEEELNSNQTFSNVLFFKYYLRASYQCYFSTQLSSTTTDFYQQIESFLSFLFFLAK